MKIVKMSMPVLRSHMKNIALDANKPHPLAIEGEWREYLQAKEKKYGGDVHHYALNGRLFWVPAMKKTAAVLAAA